jgi:hypothetical protein
VERQPERLAEAHRRASSEAGSPRQIRTPHSASVAAWVRDREQPACRVLTLEFLQFLIHLPVACLQKTPVAPKQAKQGGHKVL